MAVPTIPTGVSFGPALHAARMLRGYSRSYVSTHTGLSVGRLKFIEEGKAEPDAYEWAKVWNFLSTDPPPR
jgi:hypothetical protein